MRPRICSVISTIFLGLAACDRSEPVAINPQLAASDRSVIVTPIGDTIDVGGTQQFSAQLIQNGRQRKTTFTWSTSDTSIATVSSTGLVTGIGPGEVTITATTSRMQSGSVQVIIRQNPPGLTAHLSLSGLRAGAVVSSVGIGSTLQPQFSQ